MAIFIGLGFVLFVGPDMGSIDDEYSWMPSALGGVLLLLGVCIGSGVAAILVSRSRQVAGVLRGGEPVQGRITRVMDRGTGKYRSYHDTLEQMAKFRSTAGFRGIVLSIIEHSLKNWAVKILVTDSHGHDRELEARMDMGPRLTKGVKDPEVVLLVDRHQGHTRCVALEQFSWLSVSDSGNLVYAVADDAAKNGLGWALLRALLVVVPTYCAAVCGLKFGLIPPFGGEDGLGVPALLGAFIVPMFTFTHGVVPVFFYRLFTGVLDSFSQAKKTATDNRLRSIPFLPFLSGFVYLHMGFWYGGPMILLAALTGWLSLAWGLLHVLLAGHGRRRWVFLEHGSTSMALLLFVVCFSGRNLFPVGVMVALFQALLLTLVEWKGKGLWIKAEPNVARQRQM
ncbi:MAG: hypothetical protein CMJ81_06540 [Planctomycetaceae bacterium]|nr:hypothetical protein [Planctomycetaceae bacterium]MBP63101.1 hypothetical protein [Planctomycetaceae bacterium]